MTKMKQRELTRRWRPAAVAEVDRVAGQMSDPMDLLKRDDYPSIDAGQPATI
ncbi:hypothetical protein [Streptomyces boluensis]|uniref:Uncharacterized protein n=1 Tax=Streptomyces boluensis TaxID=1775135 RepID=A0A964UJF5_9ACTN|nr:hypothetical protein [Streptomyces boluensis]NBE50194.1 hypothetical protein [Streptomyces boluensis]